MKKRLFSLAVVALIAFSIAGCGGESSDKTVDEEGGASVNKGVPEKTKIKTNDAQEGTTAYYIQDVLFSVPTNWTMDNEKNPGTSYFYPPEGKGAELLTVAYSAISGSILDRDNLDGLISGLESGGEGFSLTGKSAEENLVGTPYASIKYTNAIQGSTYNHTAAVFDCDGGIVYFVFSELAESAYDYSLDVKNVIDSVVLSEEISQSSPTEPSITLGQLNALECAQRYLAYTSFSAEGLAGQLEYEGFSQDEIEYAVANCGADWNAQAAKKAQAYLDYSSFSRAGLIDQLLFEGFTEEQANYGVKAVGF